MILLVEVCFLVLMGAFLALFQCSVSTVTCEGSPPGSRRTPGRVAGTEPSGRRPRSEKGQWCSFLFPFSCGFVKNPVRKGDFSRALLRTPSFPDSPCPQFFLVGTFLTVQASRLQSTLKTRSMYFSAYPFSSMLSFGSSLLSQVIEGSCFCQVGWNERKRT